MPRDIFPEEVVQRLKWYMYRLIGSLTGCMRPTVERQYRRITC